MTKLRLITLCAFLGLLSACSNTTKPIPDEIPDDELSATFTRLSRIYLHADELGSENTYRGQGDSAGGIYADVVHMYSSLTDRFTRYYIPEHYQSALAMYMGSSDGNAIVGIYYQIVDDTLQAMRIIPGSPAALAGMHKGDKILTVNGENVTGTGADSYSTKASGGTGTQLEMTILRNSEILTLIIIKAVIGIPTVWLDSIDGIPVIQVDFFASRAPYSSTTGTEYEFKHILAQAGDFKSAVIDLRGNPGGSVEECLQMTDDLLDTGVIVYQIEHNYDTLLQRTVIDTTQPLVVTANSPFEKRHYVFLEDAGSASCSEIMLAGIQRNTDWPIVGATSYGKGIAQGLYASPAGGLEVITSIEFRDGNWNNYHHIGIVPSVPEADPDSALAIAVRLAKQAGVVQIALARAGTIQISDHAALARINAHLENRPTYPMGTWDFRHLRQ